ncbi:Heterokaryon incompatibility protein 6, OR allele [Pseudocercospora fuligena]|uniref:Heterokaryon incompatibility protein 6, OR allele n=1 Tax=Pseudocercospora fuligena TaxID=685502 RepID=A0A8H6VIN9_9PEZI|nr:Heterokaryon incompatibility protein 6, OR allele [Pseudocercospora fuligena]
MMDHAPKDPGLGRLPSGYIKFLVFRPACTAGELEFDVIQTPLAPAPCYHALSYAWNGTTNTRHIIVNSDRFAVTESVYNALHSIRSISTRPESMDNAGIADLPVWIDAVCINQDDLQERNDQVRQMDVIYSKAAKVLVYLGPVPPGDLNEVQLLMHATRDGMGGKLSADSTLWRHCVDWAIRKLRSRTWFDRAWVIQEVVLARFVMVVCGAYICPLDDLDNALINSEQTRNKVLYELRNALASFQRLRDARSSGNFRDCFMEVANARTLHCTDAHDHVFGLLGLLPLEDFPPEAIDYGIPVSDICIAATMYLTSHSCLSIISSEHAGEAPCAIENLPSWVPEWSMPVRPHYYPWWMYSAGGGEALQPIDTTFQDAGRTLVLEGFVVGTVATKRQISKLCSNAHTPPGFLRVDSQLLIDNLPGVHDISSVQRTICADVALTYDTTAKQGFVYKRWQDIDGTEDTVRFPDHVEQRSPTMINEPLNIMESSDSDVFLTFDTGLIGLGRAHAQCGDIAIVFPGITVPFILRKRDTSSHYKMIGPAYIHGIMDGEAMEALQRGDHKLETFSIT